VNAGSGFSFNSGVLSLTSVPLSSVGLNSIGPSAVGPGLFLSAGTIASVVGSIDNVTLENPSGSLKLKQIIGAGSSNFSNFTYNQYGQITSLSSTITQAFTGNNTSSPTLSIFNGSSDQLVYTNQTLVSAISGNGVSTANILLSSAGFIVISTNYGAGSYAIPVFRF
jgi:hypothetical protein